MEAGQPVTLLPEPGAIVPPGRYVVSKVNADGSFHVGGNTAVWPQRIAQPTRLQAGSAGRVQFAYT